MFGSLKSTFKGYMLVVGSHSFLYCIKYTYVIIKAGFLPNISDEGKDFVATWFPGFPLLSHPGYRYDFILNVLLSNKQKKIGAGGNYPLKRPF